MSLQDLRESYQKDNAGKANFLLYVLDTEPSLAKELIKQDLGFLRRNFLQFFTWLSNTRFGRLLNINNASGIFGYVHRSVETIVREKYWVRRVATEGNFFENVIQQVKENEFQIKQLNIRKKQWVNAIKEEERYRELRASREEVEERKQKRIKQLIQARDLNNLKKEFGDSLNNYPNYIWEYIKYDSERWEFPLNEQGKHYTSFVKNLLEFMISKNTFQDIICEGETLLNLAMSHGTSYLIRALIEIGETDFKIKDLHGYQFGKLCIALNGINDLNLTRSILMTIGIDKISKIHIEIKLSEGWNRVSALNAMIRAGNFDIANILLEMGAHRNLPESPFVSFRDYATNASKYRGYGKEKFEFDKNPQRNKEFLQNLMDRGFANDLTKVIDHRVGEGSVLIDDIVLLHRSFTEDEIEIFIQNIPDIELIKFKKILNLESWGLLPVINSMIANGKDIFETDTIMLLGDLHERYHAPPTGILQILIDNGADTSILNTKNYHKLHLETQTSDAFLFSTKSPSNFAPYTKACLSQELDFNSIITECLAIKDISKRSLHILDIVKFYFPEDPKPDLAEHFADSLSELVTKAEQDGLAEARKSTPYLQFSNIFKATMRQKFYNEAKEMAELLAANSLSSFEKSKLHSFIEDLHKKPELFDTYTKSLKPGLASKLLGHSDFVKLKEGIKGKDINKILMNTIYVDVAKAANSPAQYPLFAWAVNNYNSGLRMHRAHSIETTRLIILTRNILEYLTTEKLDKLDLDTLYASSTEQGEQLPVYILALELTKLERTGDSLARMQLGALQKKLLDKAYAGNENLNDKIFNFQGMKLDILGCMLISNNQLAVRQLQNGGIDFNKKFDSASGPKTYLELILDEKKPALIKGREDPNPIIVRALLTELPSNYVYNNKEISLLSTYYIEQDPDNFPAWLVTKENYVKIVEQLVDEDNLAILEKFFKLYPDLNAPIKDDVNILDIALQKEEFELAAALLQRGVTKINVNYHDHKTIIAFIEVIYELNDYAIAKRIFEQIGVEKLQQYTLPILNGEALLISAVERSRWGNCLNIANALIDIGFDVNLKQQGQDLLKSAIQAKVHPSKIALLQKLMDRGMGKLLTLFPDDKKGLREIPDTLMEEATNSCNEQECLLLLKYVSNVNKFNLYYKAYHHEAFTKELFKRGRKVLTEDTLPTSLINHDSYETSPFKARFKRLVQNGALVTGSITFTPERHNEEFNQYVGSVVNDFQAKTKSTNNFWKLTKAYMKDAAKLINLIDNFLAIKDPYKRATYKITIMTTIFAGNKDEAKMFLDLLNDVEKKYHSAKALRDDHKNFRERDDYQRLTGYYYRSIRQSFYKNTVEFVDMLDEKDLGQFEGEKVSAKYREKLMKFDGKYLTEIKLEELSAEEKLKFEQQKGELIQFDKQFKKLTKFNEFVDYLAEDPNKLAIFMKSLKPEYQKKFEDHPQVKAHKKLQNALKPTDIVSSINLIKSIIADPDQQTQQS